MVTTVEALEAKKQVLQDAAAILKAFDAGTNLVAGMEVAASRLARAKSDAAAAKEGGN